MVYKLWTVLPYSVSLHVLLRCLSGCIAAGGRISRADCKTPQNLPCRSLDIGNTPTIKTCMSVLSDNSLLLIKPVCIATIRPLKKEGGSSLFIVSHLCEWYCVPPRIPARLTNKFKGFLPPICVPPNCKVIVFRLRILTISINTRDKVKAACLLYASSVPTGSRACD